jgi:CDP-paratose 2-epimerase
MGTAGPRRAAVQLDGYLPYIVMCAVIGQPYKAHAYNEGITQARDQIHSRDVAVVCFEFYAICDPAKCIIPAAAENSLSVLETIGTLSEVGFQFECQVTSQNRTGDHICYGSDLTKVQRTSRTTQAMGTK